MIFAKMLESIPPDLPAPFLSGAIDDLSELRGKSRQGFYSINQRVLLFNEAVNQSLKAH